MSLLSQATQGCEDRPLTVLLYGPAGIGKSTFAAGADKPVFIGKRKDLERINATKLPEPSDLNGVYDSIEALRTEEHDLRTLVIDPITYWLEPMIWDHICKRDKKSNIESYGYGKGYVAAIDEWRVLLSALEQLRSERGMSIVLIAHSGLGKVREPDAEMYRRHTIDLHHQAAALLERWCGEVLFAKRERKMLLGSDDRFRAANAASGGAALVYSQWDATFNAKSRLGLPNPLPLAHLWEAMKPVPVEQLRSDVAELTAQLTDELAEQARGYASRAGDDPAKWRQLRGWCQAQIQTAA